MPATLQVFPTRTSCAVRLARLRFSPAMVLAGDTPRPPRPNVGGAILEHLLHTAVGAVQPSVDVVILDPFDDLRPQLLRCALRKTMPARVHLHVFNTRRRTLRLVAGQLVPAIRDRSDSGGGVLPLPRDLLALGTAKDDENPFLRSAHVATETLSHHDDGDGDDTTASPLVIAFFSSTRGLPGVHTPDGERQFLAELHRAGVTHTLFTEQSRDEWRRRVFVWSSDASAARRRKSLRS